jgi:hypothetical protein
MEKRNRGSFRSEPEPWKSSWKSSKKTFDLLDDNFSKPNTIDGLWTGASNKEVSKQQRLINP